MRSRKKTKPSPRPSSRPARPSRPPKFPPPWPPSSPSSTYTAAFKKFESINKDTNQDFGARTACLINAWEDSSTIILAESFFYELHNFMYHAARESTILILSSGWKNVTKKVKKTVSLVLRKMLVGLRTLNKSKIKTMSIKHCCFLLSLMKKPWSHHNFALLLHGNPSVEEISKCIQYEKGYTYVLRLRMLCEEKCEKVALKLSSVAMKLHYSKLEKKYNFEKHDFEFIRDIYFACLERTNQREKLIGYLMTYCPGNEGMILIENYCKKILSITNLQKETRPRICKNIVLVCEMAACIMVMNSLENADIFDTVVELIKKWIFIVRTLMDTDLHPDLNNSYLKTMIRAFVSVAPTANHLYLICDVIYSEFGSEFPRTFYIEMYIKAIATNLNEKLACKCLSNVAGSLEALKQLVQGYLKLANLLEDILSLCRECVLTAYSLMPSSDLMMRVESLAIKSGKLIPMDLTNVPESSSKKSKKKGSTSKKPVRKRKSKALKSDLKTNNILEDSVKNYFKIHSDLNELEDPLTRHMQEDLIAVLKNPRYWTFNWSLEWPRMKIMCQQYLENLDTVIKRNTIQRSDLIYLDMDIEEYNAKLQININKLTNNKGYFSSDNDYSDNESIASIASSGEMVTYKNRPSKSRSRKRKIGLRKRKAGSQKRRKVSPKNKPKPITTQSQPRVPLRRSLRYNKSISIDDTDDSTVSSLLNDKAQYKNTNTNNEDEDNSVDSVLEKSVKATIKNNKLPKKCRPQLRMAREKRTVNKNQHKDFDYSWCLKKKGKSTNEAFENININSIGKSLNGDQTKSQSTNFALRHSSNEHLNMLSERIPQLSSLDFIIPANINHIVNVVQIHVTSNTLTNVSQTQTDRVSNHHSNNEIEKKTSENQTNTNSLDDFVSVYQSNSLNNSINSVQNVGIHQGECSFTGSVSVSNQRITTDSITNVHNTVQQDTTSKPIGTQDMLSDQNQINLDHQHWNDIQLQNSGERLQSSIESAVHLSSNVIVRTSDVINPSHVTQTAGQMIYTTKKPSTYCAKARDRFIDLSLPASISSISTNSNRSTNIPLSMNTNKSNFDSKIQQNSPIQTSVGLQVNFNNPQSEGMQSIMSSNDQGTQIGTNITDNSASTTMSLLNDQIMNSSNSRLSNSSIVNTSFIKENSFDNLKSNIPMINPVSSIQTQTCVGLQLPGEVSHPNASVISLMIASTQSQVIKSNVHNSAYTSPHTQRMQLNDLSLTSQTNRSDEQKKIDNLKLISQTFTATSEAIKFVTSSTESQRLIQSTDKNSTSNLAVFQGSSEGVSHISQENDLNSKLSTRGRGNMRTYESKTRALKQANMSDMFVFEKGTLYAVQDDIVSHIEPTKSVISSRNNTSTNVKMQNRQSKEFLEKPKISPNASPNITITGSMLPRFQQVFGKTKFPNSTVINDTSSLCSTSVASNLSSNLGPIVNRTNISTSRVYSSSKGVQTNHDVDTISSNVNCIPPKVIENKLLHTVNMSKSSNVMMIGNNKNNVIMTCKAINSANNIPQVSASSTHQILTSNIEIKKGLASMPISKVPTTFTTSCINSSIASSSSNLIYSIPILNDSKSTNSSIEKPLQGITQLQRQLKMSPSIIQTVLRKHPTWQQNSFRQGKQNTEVQTSPIERILPASVANIVKTTIESSNNKISLSTVKPNLPETNVSTLMMEQVREFESVLEEVRKTSLMNEMSTANMLPQINHEIIQIPSPTENVDLLNTDSNQPLFPLNKKSNINNERDRCSFSFLNQTLPIVNDLASDDKELVTIQPTIVSVRSVTPTPPLTSPNNNNVSVNSVDSQCAKQIANKVKPIIKTPASSPSTSAVKVPVLQKPLPKLQEDEQTTQRIYAILDKYAEQLRNSPELKNKPAPRRRTNPPTNPSLNAKRKKTNQLNLKTCSQQTSCSSSGMEMSPTSDMQAIDSEDSSNAVSHFSHIINSPSRNSDEQSTVISETPLIENALINVNDVIKKINIEAEMKSKVSQSTQLVVSGTSGSFLSIPDGNTANVRLLVAAGNNQKMYRLHCPVTGPGPVVFHQITAKDSCSNDVKMASNLLGQNINESTILSALSADDLQIANASLGSEILHNTLQNFDHKINKSDILLESMEKAQVLDNNEKQLSFPVMKKNQASQSTFSVIHTLPCTPKSEPIENNELLSEAQNNISESIRKDYCDNERNTNMNQEHINNSNINQFVNKQEKLSTALRKEPPFIPPESLESSSLPYEDIEFPSFHTHEDDDEEEEEQQQQPNENLTIINNKNSQQNISNADENKFENTNVNQTLVDCLSDKKVSNNANDVHGVKCEDGTIVKQEHDACDITIEERPNILEFESPKKQQEENKLNLDLDNVAAASAAEIISTANQSSNTYKQKAELSPKAVKTECESENENENTLSNTVYNMLDNQSATSTNTKIGSLTLRLKNDKSAKNWINCLSKIMLPGTEKMLEGENLKRLQESFQRTKIKTFKDLKIFVFEQCKKFDNNVETPKEYDLYEDIDGLGVDKPSTNELFPEVAILNDLDKSVSPTLCLLQASTSKSNDTNALQARRKSVLSHTTTTTVIPVGVEQTSVVCKKNKTKVSFLKQALYNEMNQDSNDSETKPFINGIKTALDSIEQIDSCPESPSNTTAMDSETCMSEDSTSTISSGTPHYNFRKSKRKNVEEDGFIESQVIKRMYRGRTSEENEEKSELPKLNNIKTQTPEQKPIVEKKECNNRRISSRLKNNNVKNNQQVSNKSPQLDIPPYKVTSKRASLRRVSRKTT